MANKDPRIDAYIASAAPFARPILERFREAVHAGAPDASETMKWSFPHFVGKKILCSMAAFQAHCAIGFRLGEQVVGDAAKPGEAMGHLGKIASLADLPPKKTLVAWVKAAAALDEAGTAPARKKPAAPKAPANVPDDLAKGLSKNAKARAFFESLPPGAKREYVEWIVEAKRDETRASRLATTLEWLAEGKRKNWKYEKC